MLAFDQRGEIDDPSPDLLTALHVMACNSLPFTFVRCSPIPTVLDDGLSRGVEGAEPEPDTVLKEPSLPVPVTLLGIAVAGQIDAGMLVMLLPISKSQHAIPTLVSLFHDFARLRQLCGEAAQ